MKILSQILFYAVIVVFPAFAGVSGGGGQPSEVEGLAVVNPVTERSCIALRVDVPEGKALSGIRWFNGSAASAFPKILVASGSEDLPPIYELAIVLAENVTGQENAWSEVEFSQQVASVSGTLFVIMQFPAFYVPPSDGLSLGVGYREFDGQNNYYLSRDGDNWVKLSSNYDFLLTPVYVDRDPTVIALRGPDEGPVDQVLPDLPETTTFSAFPNPFNPEVQLKMELRESVRCEVKIYDIRGMAVRSLHSGVLPGGTTILTWNGRDGSGRNQSSGVYWAKAVIGDLSFTQQLVLLK